jgi:5-(aminomethyl)-3-furanmethanol phosphate kinase
MIVTTPVTVVKVGGSLFDIPGLGKHLISWLAELKQATLLVPGGGPLVDVLRELDRRYSLGETTSHWLALQAISINAQVLSKLIPNSEITNQKSPSWGRWEGGRVAILDAHEFARHDDGEPGGLPALWSVTSDSIAARTANALAAAELVLLKSVDWDLERNYAGAEEQGVVDPFFRNLIKRHIPVRLVNFRRWIRENASS